MIRRAFSQLNLSVLPHSAGLVIQWHSLVTLDVMETGKKSEPQNCWWGENTHLHTLQGSSMAFHPFRGLQRYNFC